MVTKSEVYPLDRSTAFREALSAVEEVKRLRLVDYDEDEGVIHAESGVSALSWGENVVIEVIPEGENTRIRTNSGTKIFSNILHGCFVEENIRQFFGALDNQLR